MPRKTALTKQQKEQARRDQEYLEEQQYESMARRSSAWSGYIAHTGARAFQVKVNDFDQKIQDTRDPKQKEVFKKEKKEYLDTCRKSPYVIL